MDTATLDRIAGHLTLGAALEDIRKDGGYTLLDHWQQGEFHHDIVLRVGQGVLIIATNCNGGIKEVLALDAVPDRAGLWHLRCPSNPEFRGPAPKIRGRSTTVHWFDPCALLADDAHSEYRPEYRERQSGGGWTCAAKKSSIPPKP